jgi:predicted transcriptional regulator
MNLTNKAIKLLQDNMQLRNQIAIELGCSEATIRRWLNENEPNNSLTTAAALKIITEETGMTQDQILTESEAVKK